jgi:hypothetical protein
MSFCGRIEGNIAGVEYLSMRYRVYIVHVPKAGPPCEGVAAEKTTVTEFELDSSSLSSLLRFLLFVVAIWWWLGSRE